MGVRALLTSLTAFCVVLGAGCDDETKNEDDASDTTDDGEGDDSDSGTVIVVPPDTVTSQDTGEPDDVEFGTDIDLTDDAFVGQDTVAPTDTTGPTDTVSPNDTNDTTVSTDTTGEDTSNPGVCPAGSAWYEFEGRCKQCRPCVNEGETGATLPNTQLNSGSCICETLPGYYTEAGLNLVPRLCDADDDGWVREPAFKAMQNPDPGIQSNARCELHMINGVTLRNEWGEDKDLDLTDIGIAPGDLLPLVEPVALDDADELARQSAQDFPAFGIALTTAMLNPLTKACVTENADFNFNGLPDLQEGQTDATPLPDPSGNRAYLRPFKRLAYFIELHSSYYRPPGGGVGPGTLIIQEHSRCGTGPGGVPLAYPDGTHAWSSSCTRRRDATFDITLSAASHDFAEWGCDRQSGTCPVPDFTGRFVESSYGPVWQHGLCERTEDSIVGMCAADPAADFCPCVPDGNGGCAARPARSSWHGMMHASQFKCVKVVTTVSTSNNAPQWRADRFDPNGINTDRWSSCTAGGVTWPAPGAPVGVANPAHATITCASGEPPAPGSAGSVGWALAWDVVEKDASGAAANGFVRGCMNEALEWDNGEEGNDGYAGLCPGKSDDLNFFNDGAAADRRDGQFGRLFCSCGTLRGGTDCSVPCVGGAIFRHGAFKSLPQCDPTTGYCEAHPDDGRPRGTWLCAAPAATTWTEAGRTSFDGVSATEGQIQLIGGVPGDRAPLGPNILEGVGSGNTWTVVP